MERHAALRIVLELGTGPRRAILGAVIHGLSLRFVQERLPRYLLRKMTEGTERGVEFTGRRSRLMAWR